MTVMLPLSLVFALFLATFAVVSAHEMYVLDPPTIVQAIAAESPNPFSAYFGNEYHFFLWGLISFIVVSTTLCASIFRIFESSLGTFFVHLKRLAHPLVRLTAGGTLVVFSIYGVLYGPELSVARAFGAGATLVQICMGVLGIALLAGAYVRFAALAAAVLYIIAGLFVGSYILTYLDHLGAYVVLFILGAGEWSLDAHLKRGLPAAQELLHRLHALAFPFLRMTFGFSIMFAAVYAKFMHSQLALEVVSAYDLTRFFPFEPLFVVLGAFIIEFAAGLMIALGIEVRWTALFLVFWLTMGHIFTNEEWWVHLVLYGTGLAILCHGYDRYSLEGRYLKRGRAEPVF